MIEIQKERRVQPGFTIIEILIVIGIMAALGAMLLPVITGQLQRSKLGSVKIALPKLRSQIDLFNVDIGQYPETLKDLVRRPVNEEMASKWAASYTSEKELNDPWGNKYQYQLTQESTEHPYELFSYGPKGKGAPKQERISVWNL